MRSVIKRMTGTAMLAVAFMLCTTSAWAAVVDPTVTKTGSSATISNAYTGNADHYKITLSSSTEYTITIPASGDFESGTGWRVAIDEIKMARHKDDSTDLIANKLLIITSEGEYISESKAESATQDNGLAKNSHTVTYAFTESPVLKVGTSARIKFLNGSDEEMAEIKYGSRDCGGATIFSSNLSHSEGTDHVYLYEVSGTMVYTCTVASDGTSSWDMDRPDSDALLLWYDIAESASFDIGTVACKKAYLNVSQGATLSLSATSISATDGLYAVGAGTLKPTTTISSAVNIAANATVFNDSSIYVSNFKGSGTIVFNNYCPATSAEDAVAVSALANTWTGTLWLRNFDANLSQVANARQLYPQFWGNSNSKIKWSAVRGRFPDDLTDDLTLASEWVLFDDSTAAATDFALMRYANSAYSANVLSIPKLSGTGSLKDNDPKNQHVKIIDVASFTGAIYSNNGAMDLMLGDGTPSSNSGRISLHNCTFNGSLNKWGSSSDNGVPVYVTDGTVTFAKKNTFAKGLYVLPGALAKTSYATSAAREAGGLGKNTGSITVYTGGCVDLANTNGTGYDITIEDGSGLSAGSNPQTIAVKNTGSDNNTGTLQTRSLTVKASATIETSKNWGLVKDGYARNSLALRKGTVLTKTGSGKFWLLNVQGSVTGSEGAAPKFVIAEGTVNACRDASDLSGIDIEVSGGTFDIDVDIGIGALNQIDGTVDIATGKTLTSTDATATSISLATLAGTGTLDLSGCTAATTLNINAGAVRAKSGWFGGTINYPSNLGTVNITLTEGEEEAGSITFDESSFSFGGASVNYQVLMKSGALVPGTYNAGTITYTEPMARIGTTGYASLADAISAAAENATVVLLGTSSEDITLNKTINFVETGTFSGTFTGNGKIILPQGVVAFKSGSAAMWPDGWTGKVEIPAFTASGATSIYFNKLGNSGSTVVLGGTLGASSGNFRWRNPTKAGESGALINPTVEIAGTVYLLDGSQSTPTTFSCVTGAGDLYVDAVNLSTSYKWHINVLTNFTGTLASSYSASDVVDTSLTIGTIALENGASLSIGDRLALIYSDESWANIKDAGSAIVTIGGVTTAYKLEKKSGGLYIAAVASATPTGGSETEYARLSDAKSALGASEGTIKLLVGTDEDITLAVGQTFNTNGKTYTGTVSPTGEHIELASVGGVYMAVDNSTNAWTSPVNGDWNDNTKWSNYVVPNTYTDVTFPAGTYTVSISSGEQCKAMEVNGYATIAYTGNSYTALNLYGDISGSGTLTLSKAGLSNQKGSELTIGCDFAAYGGPESGNNCYLAGNPFRFTNPVTISGAEGSYVKNENVTVVFEDSVTIQANAQLRANGAAITFADGFTIPANGRLTAGSSAGYVSAGVVSGLSMSTEGFTLGGSGATDVLTVQNSTFTATGDVVVGNGGTATLTIGNGGYVTVGSFGSSAADRKWVNFKTSSSGSDGNAININAGGVFEACVITIEQDTPCPSSINFNGGTLKTYAGTSDSYDGAHKLVHDSRIAVNILAGGANIDVPTSKTAHIVSEIANGLAEGTDGGLTKRGDGTLIVERAPTYVGKTSVKAGALYLPSSYTPDLYMDTVVEADDGMSGYGYTKYVFMPAASFGGNNYDTIAEAIAAAIDAGGGTVTLRRDSEEAVTTLEVGVYFSDGGYSYTGSITAAASVTDSSVTTYYATLQEAINAAGTTTVTLLQNNSEETTIDPGRTLNIEKGLFTCNAPASTGSMPVQTSVDAGITTYMAPVASVTTGGNTLYYSVVDTAFSDFVSAIGSDENATMSVLDPSAVVGYAVYFVGCGIYYSNGTLSKAVAVTTSATYGSLAAAVSYGTDTTTTITLLRNSSEAVTLSGKTITLVESGSATFTGSFTGNGTLTLGAALKSPSADRWAAGWTGTVELKDITTPIADFNFAHYGNANSVVKANNVAISVPDVAGEYGNVKEINLVNNGLVFGGSYRYDKTFTFSAKLTGSGKLRVGTPGGDSSHSTKANVAKFVFKGDFSDFRGDVDFNGLASYKAAIVFTDADDEIPTPTDWGQIIVTHDAILTTSGTLNGAGGFIIKGKIVVLSGGSMTTGGQNICGDGTISYFTSADPDKNIFTFGSWTGTVEIPQHTEGKLNLNLFGKSGSTVKLDGMSGGWPRVGYTAVNPNLYLSRDFCPSAMNDNTAFSFQKVSGEGSMVFPNSTPASISIAEIGVGYSGTITNNSSVDVSIGTIALASQPAVGSRLLKIGGRDVSVGGFTVNGVPTSIKWVRKTVDGIDGIYVISGTIFSVY